MKIQISYTHNSGRSIINTRNVIDCGAGYVQLNRSYFTDCGRACGNVGNYSMRIEDYCAETGFCIA